MKTIIQRLESIFSRYGAPNHLNSNRSLGFLARDVNKYLLLYGIASNKTIPYHLQIDAPMGCYNRIIWKIICKSQDNINKKLLLSGTLHNRSVQNLAANTTPRKRFFSFFRWSSIDIYIYLLLTPLARNSLFTLVCKTLKE